MSKPELGKMPRMRGMIQDIPKAPEKLSLLDLRRKTVTVTFSDGREIEVSGLSTADLAELMDKFPPLQKFFLRFPMTIAEVIEAAPGAMAYMIVAGCDMKGNEEALKVAQSLTIEEQSELLEGIGKATFTRGFGPFDSRMQALGMQLAATGKAQVTTPPKPLRPIGPITEEAPKTPSPSPPDNSPPGTSSPSETESAA